MKVTVDLEDAVFWRLAARAQRDDKRVDQVLVEMATSASKRAYSNEDPVALLWGRGLTDGQIAGELNMLRGLVATRRRAFGLPANKTGQEK